MSIQTREQAIGYVLKASLDSKIEANKLIDVALICSKKIYKNVTMDNYETMKMMEIISGEMELSEEITDQLKSNLYHAFDMKTVEEAGDIFNGFCYVYPFLTTE